MVTNESSSDLEKYRLTVDVSNDHVIQHARDSTGRATSQTWRQGRKLGQGGFAEVFQQVWEDEHDDVHYRAVKVCLERNMKNNKIDYKRELSALAAFSNSEVINTSSLILLVLTPIVFWVLRQPPRLVDRIRKILHCNGISPLWRSVQICHYWHF